MVDAQPLLSFSLNDEGTVEITASLFDKENREVASIYKNEWVTGDSTLWDLESGYQSLKIRFKPGDIRLEINTKCNPIRLKAQLWWNGCAFTIKPGKLMFAGFQTNQMISGSSFVDQSILANTAARTFEIGKAENLLVGGRSDSAAMISMTNVGRPGHGIRVANCTFTNCEVGISLSNSHVDVTDSNFGEPRRVKVEELK